eukprot:Clim_evm4s220 gene=Clim_evmTU4s220
MATRFRQPTETKRRKLKAVEEGEKIDEIRQKHAFVQLVTDDGTKLGPQLDIQLSTNTSELQILTTELRRAAEEDRQRNKTREQKENDVDEEFDPDVPYSFFVNDEEITTELHETITRLEQNLEGTITITCRPEAVFKVRAVSRSAGSLPGHQDAVLCASFSPNSRWIASAGGDTTVRIWDPLTVTPKYTLRGHKDWVLQTAWSPDARFVASGDKKGIVYVWDVLEKGAAHWGNMKGHKSFITGIAWEPFHRNEGKCCRFLTSSKDGTTRMWDVLRKQCVLALSQHTASVTCVRWGGNGLMYTGSQDRTIKVWRDKDGALCRTLAGHAHWVNTMALHTDYILRLGPFSYAQKQLPYVRSGNGHDTQRLAAVAKAQKAYDDVRNLCKDGERLITGSDDYTMYLWSPETDKKPLKRLTGHQQLINMVAFDPRGQYIASASFDKSVKLWTVDGKFLTSFRAHVGPVYQVAWSADGRLFVSVSADSTVKVWNLKKRKMIQDLPGHADEVYAVDWSPDGEFSVSGSKDKTLKLWRP